MIKTELCIIGAGAAGLSLAAGASQLGLKVTLIEQGKMGGDCLNTGCVPSKALLAAAKRHWQALNASELGLHVVKAQADFAKVMAHVRKAIQTIEPDDSAERFEALGCDVLVGKAQFIDSKTLQVGDKQLQAAKFIIAAGSKPALPNITGLMDVAYHTNESIFDIQRLPKHLIIIGGGPIGCELGQALAMLGAKVSIIARNRILAKEDQQAVEVVRTSLKEAGVNVYEYARLESVAELNQRLVAVFYHDGKEQILTGDKLLIATGRKANIEDLALDKAQVACHQQGVKVNSRLQTTNPNIYAMGDVTGLHHFTHMANYHAGILLKNILFRWPAKVQSYYMPRVTYTSPELAQVGMTSAEAEQAGLKHQLVELPFSRNHRAICDGQIAGFIKLVLNRWHKVIGVTIVGAQAGELLMPWLMVVKEKRSLKKITDLIVPYPTLSEINKQVASHHLSPALFSNKVKRLVSWLKKC